MSVRLADAAMDEPVSRHMSRDFVKLRAEQTVDQALAQLRRNPPPGRIIYFYVVDADDRLVGVVPTRRLLLSQHDATIDSIMVRNAIAVPDTATVLDACEFFTMHRLLAFPVVDAERRIAGIVDVELYTEGLGELEESQRSDDLFQLIGVHLAEAHQHNPVAAFRSRFPWLVCNIVGGVLAALLSGVFEAELQAVVALAMFVPVTLALAESVSIQSVSLTLQMLHGQAPTWRALAGKLRREFFTGGLLGVASSVTVAIVAVVWLQDWRVGVCILAGITGGVTSAAIIGVAMPNVLRMLHRNPQVAAGPIALASTDMVTLLAYFGMARILLS